MDRSQYVEDMEYQYRLEYDIDEDAVLTDDQEESFNKNWVSDGLSETMYDSMQNSITEAQQLEIDAIDESLNDAFEILDNASMRQASIKEETTRNVKEEKQRAAMEKNAKEELEMVRKAAEKKATKLKKAADEKAAKDARYAEAKRLKEEEIAYNLAITQKEAEVGNIADPKLRAQAKQQL